MAGTNGVEKKAAAAAAKHAKKPRPYLQCGRSAIIAVLVVVAAVAASFVLPSVGSAPQEAKPQESVEVQTLTSAARTLFKQGQFKEAIDALVAAQRQDVASVLPAEALQEFRQSFAGGKTPHHVKTVMKQAMERLEQTLFEAMLKQGALTENQGHDALLRLAKLKMLYHPAANLQQATEDVTVAARLLSEPLQPADADTEVKECRGVAESLSKVLEDRKKYTEELRSGVSAKDLAKKLHPQPAFQSVDRRKGLTVKEYFEEYVAKGRPVIITDYADRTLRGGAWGWEEMVAACGDMEVLISERLDEARHLWAGLGFTNEKQTLAEWIGQVRGGQAPKNAYLMDWGLATRCDNFTQAFNVPKYFTSDLWKRWDFNSSEARDLFARHPSVFVGAAGSGGALHVDSYASTFWQLLLKGTKRWTLYALPDHLRRVLLYAGVEHEIMPLVPLPGRSHDAEALPLLDVANEFKVTAEVGPGELMVVPFDVPHMVENVEDVLAISMNVLHPPATPRLAEDLHARSCFSSDESLAANLRVLSEAPKPQEPAEQDVPYDSYRTYKPL